MHALVPYVVQRSSSVSSSRQVASPTVSSSISYETLQVTQGVLQMLWDPVASLELEAALLGRARDPASGIESDGCFDPVTKNYMRLYMERLAVSTLPYERWLCMHGCAPGSPKARKNGSVLCVHCI